MPMSDQVLNHMNVLGSRSKHKEYRNKLEVINWTKEKYDQDNDAIEGNKGLIKEEPGHTLTYLSRVKEWIFH